jgi:Ca2+-binding EF-hand superfamily protein
MSAVTLAGAALAAGGAASAQPAPQGSRPAAEMTREQVQARAAEAFARLDLNRDGKLDQGDRQARQKAVFDRVDADHNGAITQAEFSAVREQRREAAGDRQAQSAGQRRDDGVQARGQRGPGGPGPMARGPRNQGVPGARADGNNDGTVTPTEFAAAALERFERADANKDGKVTRAERRTRQMRGAGPARNAG